MRGLVTLSLTGILGYLGYVGLNKIAQLSELSRIDVRARSIRISGLSAGTLSGELDLSIDNRTAASLSVKNIIIELFLEGQRLAVIFAETATVPVGSHTATLKFKAEPGIVISFPPQALVASALTAEGSLEVLIPPVGVAVPVRFTNVINVGDELSSILDQALQRIIK